MKAQMLMPAAAILLVLPGGPLRAGADEPPAGAQVAYADDFEEVPGPEWSQQRTERTPRGKRGFLGQFAREDVTLGLDRLPAHKWVRVSFDLFIIRTWDGYETDDGLPDTWRLDVVGGPGLVCTSFHTTHPTMPTTPRQAYPDDLPGRNPHGTGAKESITLGFERPPKHPGDGHWESMDSVYHLEALFPHAGATLSLRFAGEHLQSVEDESWGLDNVKVEVLPGPPNRGADQRQLLAWWKDLTGVDAVKANAAKWALVGVGEEVVPFLAAHIKDHPSAPPLPPERRQAIEKLIADLDSDDWRTRERASAELKKIVKEAESLLRQALATTKSAEVQWRVEDILQTARAPGGAGRPPEPWVGRVRRILEVIGTDPARRLLKTLPDPEPRGAPRPADGWTRARNGLIPAAGL